MNEEKQEEVVETAEEIKTSETSYEQEAKESNWVDKETFLERGGDPKDFVDAKTFIDRGPFIKQIVKQAKQMEALVSYNEKIIKQNEQAELRGYQRALKELEGQRDQVYSSGDPHQIKAFEKEIIKTEQKVEDSQRQLDMHPAVADFTRRNAEWWNKDLGKTQRAIEAERELQQQYPTMNKYELLQMVEDKINNQSPAPVKQKSYEVASPTRVTGTDNLDAKQYSVHDLTNEAKLIFGSLQKTYENRGKKFTVAEYVAEHKKVFQGSTEGLFRKK